MSSAADAAALAVIAESRERMRRASADLSLLRHRADELAGRTGWCSRAADGYRESLSQWRAHLAACAARLDAWDDELRRAAARLETRLDAHLATGGS